MTKIDPRMLPYLGEFSAAASGATSTTASALPVTPSVGVQTAAELLRQSAEASRVAAEMWTRDAIGDESIRFQGRFVKAVGAFSVEASTGRMDVENREFRQGDDKRYLSCDHSLVIVNKECNEQNVARFLLQEDRFLWAQAQVKLLLAQKATLPRITRYNAPRWAAWVRDVFKYVSLAYWSLNVRAYAPYVPSDPTTWTGATPTKKTWLAWDGPRVVALRDRLLVAMRAAGGRVRDEQDLTGWVPLGAAMPKLQAMADLAGVQEGKSFLPWEATPRRNPLFNTWDVTGATNQIPSVPKNEDAFVSDFGGTTDAAYRYYGPTSLYIRHPSKQVEASGVYGPQSSEVFNNVGTGFDRFSRWMEATSTFAAGDRPTVVHTGYYNLRGRFVWEPVLAADGQIEWATAIAEDLVIGSYAGILMESMDRWRQSIDLMPPYVKDGVKALSDAIRTAQDQNRVIFRQRIDTAQTAGTTFQSFASQGQQSGNANVVTALSSAIYEVFRQLLDTPAGPLARGASSIPWCPPAPMMRVMTQPGCDLAEMVRRASFTYALTPAGVRPASTDKDVISPSTPAAGTPAADTPADGADSRETPIRTAVTTPPEGGGGALLFGAGVVALYFLLRRP